MFSDQYFNELAEAMSRGREATNDLEKHIQSGCAWHQDTKFSKNLHYMLFDSKLPEIQGTYRKIRPNLWQHTVNKALYIYPAWNGYLYIGYFNQMDGLGKFIRTRITSGDMDLKTVKWQRYDETMDADRDYNKWAMTQDDEVCVFKKTDSQEYYDEQIRDQTESWKLAKDMVIPFDESKIKPDDPEYRYCGTWSRHVTIMINRRPVWEGPNGKWLYYSSNCWVIGSKFSMLNGHNTSNAGNYISYSSSLTPLDSSNWKRRTSDKSITDSPIKFIIKPGVDDEINQLIADNFGGSEANVPDEFKCPIMMELMLDPVVAEDGHTYERRVIEQHLSVNLKSPMTNAVLTVRMVFPNHALRSMIRNHKMHVEDVVVESTS